MSATKTRARGGPSEPAARFSDWSDPLSDPIEMPRAICRSQGPVSALAESMPVQFTAIRPVKLSFTEGGARLILIKTADTQSAHLPCKGWPSQYALTEEAPMAKTDPGATVAFATPDDIKGVLGDLDQAQVLAIMSLRPTIADLEQASVWLDGDPDVFGAGMAVQGVASEIVAILTENEDEEPPRTG
ncbi:hypothetical protein [Bradyrhizobium sediminis]|nr:hypothetical protein [Bradyrhizobium sediminis]